LLRWLDQISLEKRFDCRKAEETAAPIIKSETQRSEFQKPVKYYYN